ncbi:peptidoglycan DD-metalloendopeptidase family protein [Spirosoma endbachense]|uniref:Peptidoglycan DD-metalloendopeptidase family protein n=2 Tax=Spirosoma endbachense TaxID=2666025 RepID=A0A6P1VPH7_9BACT|nr:peptidoglycan DD-metalloendopeptidase family protein [Spirosoma endbachense]
MKIDITSFMRVAGLMAAVLVGGINVASSQVVTGNSSDPTLYDYCQQYQTLYTKIREQAVTPDSARLEFSAIMKGLQERFLSSETIPSDSLQRDSLLRTGTYFSFPIRGYTKSAIGGSRGEGYRGNGFDLFDYNVRGSHPAQDIFIVDRNQDTNDDRTGQPVDILAMTSGLVLAIETDWHPGSDYRGGNWIWVYDPILNGLFYYAHNNQVDVSPGQWVKAGQKLAEMGRSGFNAYKTRSPTHLHLMYLQIQPNGLPQPLDTYQWLLMAQLSK